MTPQTHTSKGNLNLGTCEHPLQIGALFTFLYLFFAPIFQMKCEQTIPKPSKKCDEYTLFHASRTFIQSFLRHIGRIFMREIPNFPSLHSRGFDYNHI